MNSVENPNVFSFSFFLLSCDSLSLKLRGVYIEVGRI